MTSSTASPPSKVWEYGVTTCPGRLDTLLPQTLASLTAAGFDKPTLFIDALPPTEITKIEDRFHLPVRARWPRIRAYGNWLLGLVEMVTRNPLADFYALFQDDILTYKNLRSYLEQCRYPDHPRIGIGYWNLYTTAENEQKVPTINGTEKQVGWWLSNQCGRGAVGLIFSNAIAIRFLGTQHTFDRMRNPERGCQSIDGAVVQSLCSYGIKEYCHYPSLTYHTGEESSMVEHHPTHRRSQPQAATFYGQDFDALELLKKKKP